MSNTTERGEKKSKIIHDIFVQFVFIVSFSYLFALAVVRGVYFFNATFAEKLFPLVVSFSKTKASAIILGVVIVCFLLSLSYFIFIKKVINFQLFTVLRDRWQIIHRFLQILHEYWIPVGTKSILKFAVAVAAMLLFSISLYFLFISGLVSLLNSINPSFVERTAPGLAKWIHGIIFSKMSFVFLGFFVFPVVYFSIIFKSIKNKIIPWVMLFVVAIFMFGVSGLNVIISYVGRFFQTALAGKDQHNFWYFLVVYAIVFFVGAFVVAFYWYIRQRLQLIWRKFVAEVFIDRYLTKRSYYAIANDKTVDNPDQRISEDVKNFTISSLYFFTVVIGAITDLIAFIGILWLISHDLTFILLAYAFFGTIITILFGKPLIGLNFKQLQKEADFRYGLIHIRDNAESIAFYQGEEKEKVRVFQILDRVLQNFAILIKWRTGLLLYQKLYDYLVVILPTAIIAPLYFSGKLDFGAISQANFAFNMVLGSLSIVVVEFDTITSYVAGVKRLTFFDKKIMAGMDGRTDEKYKKISFSDSKSVSMRNLNLDTPDGVRHLISKLELVLKPGDRLLIAGPSGVGKTSLLRAIAGLWNRGSGSIERPKLSDSLFLPQKPYMILGSLREQILYPKAKNISDKNLEKILQHVMLGSLVKKMKAASEGNIFDRIEKWDDYLSQGEQQRLAFARVFATDPNFVILDEATSALDVGNERHLYDALSKLSIPYISVGHRPALALYHDKVLLVNEEGWQLLTPKAYLKVMAQITASKKKAKK